SYGIQVAKLAGVPDNVLKRAREIANQLENKDTSTLDNVLHSMAAAKSENGEQTMTQLSIFDTMGNEQTEDVLFELRDIDLSCITPMDAMNLVYKWQKKLQDQW
ncbi:MAG: DNA mismatch repair protein MutS, partial [Eubacterium sp.]|nr:DNA mismatch repair protein MutS [Eubacterium sp.]